MRDWKSRKPRSNGSPHVNIRLAKGLLKRPSTGEGCGEGGGTRESLNLSTDQLVTMIDSLTGHCHLKGHLLNWGWYTVPTAIAASRHLKEPHIFFVIVGLCLHYNSGIWVIIL
jgi:hypothetical protein